MGQSNLFATDNSFDGCDPLTLILSLKIGFTRRRVTAKAPAGHSASRGIAH